MKKLLFFLLISFGFSFAASAQAKAMQTIKIDLPTVQCGMCKSKIETYLKRMDGVGYVNVNYKGKYATVKYAVDRVTDEEIKTAIANVGYDANEIPANPESYNKLPKCCKKPEDGGGMKKD